MSKVPPELLAALPESLRGAFASLYPRGETGSVHELRAQIDEHTRTTTRAAGKNEFVDTTLSHRIARGLRIVLEDWDGMSQARRAAVHATVAYYSLREDAEDDLDSVLGFEDDAQVFNACLQFLDRPELQIEFE